MKQTPGPWEATPGRKVIGKRVPEGYMDLICDLSESPWVDDIPYNSLLIAAAPDLLEACKMAHRLLLQINNHEDYTIRTINDLSNAISKADGRAP